MKKYTKEEFLKAAEIGEEYDLEADKDCGGIYYER